MTRIAPAAAPKPAFDDIAPFPGENRAASIGHNRAPLEEQIVADLDAAIDDVPGLRTRIRDLLAKAGSLPACTDEEIAGKLGDFKKMCDAASSRVEAARKALKDPVLAAGRNLDAKARTYTDALDEAARQAKRLIDAYAAEVARKQRAEAARRAAEEEARRREAWEREQAARAAQEAGEAQPPAEPEPEPMPQRAEKAAPLAMGDMGARVGTRTVWKADPVTSLKGLPASVTGHPKVIEAANTVIAGLVRAGAREIKGVTIREHVEANIR